MVRDVVLGNTKDTDDSSLFWGLFFMFVALLLWHGDGWEWKAGSVFTFLMGLYSLPPIFVSCKIDDEVHKETNGDEEE